MLKPEFVEKKCECMPTTPRGEEDSDEERFPEPQFLSNEESDSESEYYIDVYDSDSE